MAKRCRRTALYLNYQREYCRYMSATYDMMEATLDYMLQQPKLKKKKCAIVLDIDGFLISEDDICANREIFTRAMNFIIDMKNLYKKKLTIFIITARQSDEGVAEDLNKYGILCGKDQDIEAVLFDYNQIGTIPSKIDNRKLIRDAGYTIILAGGDNHYSDLVPENETSGFSQTANFLLPNIYRHEYTS